MALVVGAYYHWGVRAAGHNIDWNGDTLGYYNFLGRAFANGHTYLEIEPKPELLALPNPWDPRVPDELKLFDAVLYNRRYYLYHGAGPAVLLFAPWRLLTGRDLPENFALFLMCFGGWIFSAFAARGLLRMAGADPGPVVWTLLLVALAFCQGVPFLLNRVWVYEIAIGGGYLFVSGGIYFLVRAWGSGRTRDLVLAGFLFGCAISCRPHLGLIGAVAVAMLLWRFRQRGFAAILPFAAVGLMVCGYNLARFGNPLEFGNNHLLGGAHQTTVVPEMANVGPGLYYMLACEPEFSKVFPWIRAVPRLAPGGVPPHYTLEALVGALWLAPFVVFLLLAGYGGAARPILAALVLHAGGLLAFVVSTGWSVPRYQVDFLPVFVLVASVAFAAALPRLPRIAQLCATVVFGTLVCFGTGANLALGIAGPIDEMLKNKPARYATIAGWLSPVARYRPVLNSGFDIAIAKRSAGTLLRAGVPAQPYELILEPGGHLVSRFSGNDVRGELPEGVRDLRARYAPGSGLLQVVADGVPVLTQKIGPLVSTPPQ